MLIEILYNHFFKKNQMNYNKLFSVELLHDYFRNNIAKDISVQPTKETKDWMMQNNCLLKGQGNVWSVFIPKDLEDGARPNTLEFECQSADYNFINFTDFPIDEIGCLYFSNESDPTDEGLKSEFKSAEDHVPAAALIQIDLSKINEAGSEFRIQFNSRKLCWKYFIINTTGKNFTEIKLIGDNSELFEGPTDVELPTGQKSQLFDSKSNLFPFQEMGGMDLKLSIAENAAPATLILLPNASAQSIERNKEGKIKAAIYVYI